MKRILMTWYFMYGKCFFRKNYHSAKYLCYNIKMNQSFSQFNSFSTYHLTSQQVNRQRNGIIDTINDKNPNDIFNFAVSLLNDIQPKSMRTTTFLNSSKRITILLFQLRILKAENLMLKLFNEILLKNVQLDSTYTVIMKFYVDNKNYDKVREYFEKLQDDPYVSVTARCYVPLICASIQSQQFREALGYLDNLNNLLKTYFQYHLYYDIIKSCSKIANKENYDEVSEIISKILYAIEYYGTSYLKNDIADAFEEWFSKQVNKEIWYLKKTKIYKKSGICHHCKHDISSADIPIERRIQLKRNLMALIKSSISKKKFSKLSDVKLHKTSPILKQKLGKQANYFELYDMFSKNYETGNDKELMKMTKDLMSSETFSVLKGLKALLDNSKPFDIVIDVLNLGYFVEGFDPIHVYNVIKYFVEKKQSILILCAGLLKEDLLDPHIEVPKSKKRIQALLKYLNEHCQLYFVESSLVDDYYILYTLLHHDFKIKLVSSDRFTDHLYHLTLENVADFKTWQQANQLIFKSFDKIGQPVFQQTYDYRLTVHSHDNGWHIPVAKDKWFCVQKIHSQI